MKHKLFLLLCVILVFGVLIIPASAAESDLTLEYKNINEVWSSVKLSPGMYTISFNYSSDDVDDWVSDPVDIPDFLPEDCNAPILVYRDGDAIYSLTLCQFEGEYTYSFQTLSGKDQYDITYIGHVLVTFSPTADEPDLPVNQDTSIIDSVLDVFGALGSWIVGALGNVSAVFYNVSAGQLTLLGVLAVATLGIGFAFLLIGLIQNFIKFRS